MKKEKKGLVGIIVLIIVIVIVIALFIAGLLVYRFISKRLENVNYVEIDKSDIGIVEIYEEPKEDKNEEVKFDSVKTIALFGTDSRNVDDMYSGRADSIIIASLNPEKYSVKLISIPRDTYVDIPGYYMDKINHAFAFGQEQLLLKTLNNNFGINVSEYITVDFLGLARVINSIGGINLTISQDEMNVINDYLKEIYALEGTPYTPMTEFGDVLLTGEQAVAHSRDRYVGSDFTRGERQRQVIEAIINKISTFDSDRQIKFIDDFLAQVHTNVNITEYLPQILSVLLNMDKYNENIISSQVPTLDYASGQYINGIYYLVCDLDRAKEEFRTYIYEK